MKSCIAVLCFFVSGAIAVSQAEAQSVSEQEAADALFEEGIRLRNAGDHAAACARFVKSQAIEPALGTLQNIGMCLEQQNKLIAALGKFRELLDGAEEAKDRDRIRVAQASLSKLRRIVPTLLISVSDDSDIPGLEILVNGQLMRAALLGVSTPVNPGSYAVSARAPRHERWTKTVVLKPKQSANIFVPKLVSANEATSTKHGPAVRPPPPVAVKRDEESKDDDKLPSSVTDANRKLRASLAIGPSFYMIEGVDYSAQFAIAAEATWRLPVPGRIIEVGGLFTASSLSLSGSATTGVFAMLATGTHVEPLQGQWQKWRLRGQVGLGLLALTGLDELGHPLLQRNITADGVVRLAHFRVALGFDYQIEARMRLVVTPLSYWYSPTDSTFETGINALTGIQSMAGASYSF